MSKNALHQIRESRMLSKAELARKAGISVQTITRIEQGMHCRVKTKRKRGNKDGRQVSGQAYNTRQEIWVGT